MKQRAKCSLWAGRILTGLAALLFLVDSVMKLLQLGPVMQGTAEIGFPSRSVFPLGLILLIATLLYIYRRTAFWGALILTGYLGGAVAVHVRLGNPVFTHLLSPIYVAIIVWAGLYFRDERVRTLVCCK